MLGAQKIENSVGVDDFQSDLFSYVMNKIPHINDDNVKADIAWRVDRYWLQRRSPDSLRTLTYLTQLLQLSSGYYPELNNQGEEKLGKLQPSLNEAMEETIKRLRFLFQFTSQLSTTILSCISGGSMSYGRFLNIRGSDDPSDLDLILVYENGAEDELTAQNILPNDLFSNPDEARLLDERIKFFAELKKQGKAEVLSQKTAVVSENFEVSMHLMSRAVFCNSILHDVVLDLRKEDDVDRKLLDYKPKSFKYKTMKQKNFNGEIEEFEVDEKTISNGVRNNEVISSITSYAIRSGLFVPGIYQNLISPRFEFEPFTSPEISSVVMSYWLLMQALQAQYRKNNPQSSVLKSHIRYDIFSPKLKNQL